MTSYRLWWRKAGMCQSVGTLDVHPVTDIQTALEAMVKGLRANGFEAGLIKLDQVEADVKID